MNIKTKYEVGQHIWFIYEHGGEVHVYDDYISSIGWEDHLFYLTKDSCEELKEEEIILYEETDKIKELMKKIREREKEENND